MTTDPQWLQAAQTIGIDCKEPPDALEPEQIGRLQYTTDVRARNALIAALRSDIENGSLPAVQHVKAEPVIIEVPVRRCPHEGVDYDADWGSSVEEWKEMGGRVRQQESGAREVGYVVIEAAAFAKWTGVPESKRSEFVRAWLRPLTAAASVVAVAPLNVAAESSSPEMTKDQIISYWLGECERIAKEMELSFCREHMPGKKADFLAFLHAIEPELKNIKKVESLKPYLKKCGFAWPRDAGSKESALPLYAKLFPEQADAILKAGSDGNPEKVQQRKTA
ncbi:hypothetical protein [Thauera sp. SDU_THAU2]|uniref:hypothetical protein n=1 Tax=Thauera sp. SDU_THAU2 TaxID=3136633 RepID=UPI00311DBF86